MIDAAKSGENTSKVWEELAQRFADAIPDLFIGGEPQKAIQYATYAEACWWQATGEGDAWNVKDVLPKEIAALPPTQ